MPPSISLFREVLLTPLTIWRCNCHPLPQGKPEKYLNDAERWDPSTIPFYFLVLLS
jgi:hypothetical protein